MSGRTVYAWEQDGKFYLSSLRPGAADRPRNQYETREALLAEAARRRVRVEWE